MMDNTQLTTPGQAGRIPASRTRVFVMKGIGDRLMHLPQSLTVDQFLTTLIEQKTARIDADIGNYVLPTITLTFERHPNGQYNPWVTTANELFRNWQHQIRNLTGYPDQRNSRFDRVTATLLVANLAEDLVKVESAWYGMLMHPVAFPEENDLEYFRVKLQGRAAIQDSIQRGIAQNVWNNTRKLTGGS